MFYFSTEILRCFGSTYSLNILFLIPQLSNTDESKRCRTEALCPSHGKIEFSSWSIRGISTFVFHDIRIISLQSGRDSVKFNNAVTRPTTKLPAALWPTEKHYKGEVRASSYQLRLRFPWTLTATRIRRNYREPKRSSW